MPPPRSTHRRARGGSPVAAQVLAQLTAARAQLDAEVADRRRREDDLLREFAAAAGAAAAVVTRRDTALADLEQRRQAILEAASVETVATEARQAAALAGLTEVRTAEEIGALVGMNEKRVRHIVRAHRAAFSEIGDGGPAAGAVADVDLAGSAEAEPTRPREPSESPVEQVTADGLHAESLPAEGPTDPAPSAQLPAAGDSNSSNGSANTGGG